MNPPSNDTVTFDPHFAFSSPERYDTPSEALPNTTSAERTAAVPTATRATQNSVTVAR
jgi:hypothetical protein